MSFSSFLICWLWGLNWVSPGGSAVNNLPAMQKTACNAGDVRLIPSWGRSPRELNGNPVQYSCPGNATDREAWQATVHWFTRVGPNLRTEAPALHATCNMLRAGSTWLTMTKSNYYCLKTWPNNKISNSATLYNIIESTDRRYSKGNCK